jgi:hypothetical protein
MLIGTLILCAAVLINVATGQQENPPPQGCAFG